MKGEVLAKGSRWEGSPAQKIQKLMPISQVKPTLSQMKEEVLTEDSKWGGSPAQLRPKLILMSQVKLTLYPWMNAETLKIFHEVEEGLMKDLNVPEIEMDEIGRMI
jgi:hypothetical protein